MPSINGLRLRLQALRMPRVGPLYYCGGGLGDELMFTAVARAARDQGRPIHVLTDLPQVWRDNPDPLSVQTGIERWWSVARLKWRPTNIQHLSCDLSADGHLADQMAAKIPCTLPLNWRPILTSPKQKMKRLVIAVAISCRGAKYPSPTKEWPIEKWQRLVEYLRQFAPIVQLGTSKDPKLDDVQDMRGSTTIDDAAQVLRGATLFVGLESGLQHLAAAVHAPSVIIFGGRSRPDQTGYPFNSNITRRPTCSPCGLNDGCPHNMLCMNISVEEVLSQCEAVLRERTFDTFSA